MATAVPPKKNTAYVFYTGLVSQANTMLLKANPTLAAGDVVVSIDGGATANLATLPTVTPAAGKQVKISLSAGEMNGDNIVVTFSDVAGAEWCDQLIELQTVSRQVDDLAYPATSGRSMVVDAAGLVDANAVKVGPTGSGTAQTAGDVIGDTNDIQARLPAALVGGRMDASMGAVAAGAIAAASFAANALDAVWSATTRLLTAGTNIVLAKGVGVTGFNDLSAAQVNAEADTALADVGLTTTITNRIDAAISTRAATGAAMTLTTGERTAVANEVEAQIIDETDSEKVLVAITDKIASVNPSLGALTLAAIASQVRTELTTELARIDVAGSTRLAAAGYTAPLDAAAVRAALGFGAANFDTQIGDLPTNTELGTALAGLTIPTAAQVRAEMDANSTKLTSINDKTTNLPSDPADQSLIIAATGALVTLIGDVPTNAELATALAGADDVALAQIALVKAKTDSLTFGVAGKLDANVTHVNEIEVTGAGTVASPWGPV